MPRSLTCVCFSVLVLLPNILKYSTNQHDEKIQYTEKEKKIWLSKIYAYMVTNTTY